MLTLLAVLLLATPAGAGFDEGMTAYNRGDYATALREWGSLAKQGNASAQYGLGWMYAAGRGVPQDYGEAERWFRKAAEQGNAEAQFNLGQIYRMGEGVPQDYAEGMRWYRKAAEQGDAAAQNNLGWMYANGQGAPIDYVRAHFWYNLAAAQGDANAAKNRDFVTKRMTSAQVVEAQKLARDWWANFKNPLRERPLPSPSSASDLSG